jgi:hypothetical protein
LDQFEAERFDLGECAMKRSLVGEQTRFTVSSLFPGLEGWGTRSGSSRPGDRGHGPG